MTKGLPTTACYRRVVLATLRSATTGHSDSTSHKVPGTALLLYVAYLRPRWLDRRRRDDRRCRPAVAKPKLQPLSRTARLPSPRFCPSLSGYQSRARLRWSRTGGTVLPAMETGQDCPFG